MGSYESKNRRLGNLEHELIAAAKGRKIELSVSEIRRKGLLAALRQDIQQGLKSGPARPWNVETIKHEGLKRLATSQNSRGK